MLKQKKITNSHSTSRLIGPLYIEINPEKRNNDFLFKKIFITEGYTSLCNWTQHIKSRDINIELPYIM